MGILKDWVEDNACYRLNIYILYFFSPKVWFRLHKYRKQRADRGWSDRDVWGAGEHIAKMTAEILQRLNDNAIADWTAWFENNIQSKSGYKDLQSVIDDINNYLEHEKTSWADGLDIDYNKKKSAGHDLSSGRWVDKATREPISEQQIRERTKKWRDEEMRLYKKAQSAMQFFGKNFASFWD